MANERKDIPCQERALDGDCLCSEPYVPCEKAVCPYTLEQLQNRSLIHDRDLKKNQKAKEFIRKDFGKINFGRYKGKEWNKLPDWYLERISEPDCKISDHDKKIARQVLQQKKIIDGQLEFGY